MQSYSILGTADIEHVVFDASNSAPCLRNYLNCHRGEFVDFTIIVGSKSFMGHRIVLCQRSQYFHGLLHTPLSAVHTNKVELMNMTPSIFKIIFDFLYCNTLDVNCNNVCDIFMASNYLMVEETKEYCTQYLKTALQVNNFFPILRMAEDTQSPKLLEITNKFLLDNLMEICDSDDFKQLDQKDVVELLSSIRKEQISHEIFYTGIVGWVNFACNERRTLLGELLKIIDFNKMSSSFVQANVSTEKLMEVRLRELELPYVWQILQRQAMTISEVCDTAAEKQILIIGGIDTKKEVSSLDMKEKTLVNVLDLPFDHLYGCAVPIADGKILCCGGGKFKGGPFTNEAHVITNTTKGLECKPARSMGRKRCGASAAIHDDSIYVSGGLTDDDNFVRENEAYALSKNEWNAIPDWDTLSFSHTLLSYGGYVLSVGGWDGKKSLNTVERFDPVARKVSAVASMKSRRNWHAVVVLGNDIYAIGGWDGKAIVNSVEKYSNGEWSFVAPMNKARYQSAAFVICNRIFVVGGDYDNDGNADGGETTIEMYDPIFDHWSIFCRTEKCYRAHSVVVV